MTKRLKTWEIRYNRLREFWNGCTVTMTDLGNFVARLGDHVELRDDGILGSIAGHGATVEDAVNDLYEAMTQEFPPHVRKHYVRDAMQKSRAAFRWNPQLLCWVGFKESDR